jgi:methylase of polypeptide subunit release factors
MPRLPPSVLTTVARESPLLSLLLKECRTVESARNELRWLRERALRDGPARGWATRLKSMCRARSRGFPLQYVLGDQPFGDLNILCRRGVLIPRSAPGSISIRGEYLSNRS